MSKNINEVELTIFDLETTGLDPRLGERIVEIAAIRLKDKRSLAVFQSLVNPGKKTISLEAFSVNHITQEMLKDAPLIDEVLPKFLDFISGSCIAAYNAPFDLNFLSSELRLIKRQLPEDIEIIDILTMAKKMLPGIERYALSFVAKHFGIGAIQEHRALSDTHLTVEVFHRLNSILIQKGIVDFEQYISLFGLDSQLLENINNAKLACVQRALDLGASLKLKYLTAYNAQITEREIIPRLITQRRNRTYLVGYCKLREEERAFRIENILRLEMGRPLTDQ
ncbi:MAG: exonuclease domain-containing protein [Candidatus Omnitrophota bacterium]